MGIREFIQGLSLSTSKHEEEMETIEMLLSHPKNRDRLLSSINTPCRDHVAFETIDDLKGELGI